MQFAMGRKALHWPGNQAGQTIAAHRSVTTLTCLLAASAAFTTEAKPRLQDKHHGPVSLYFILESTLLPCELCLEFSLGASMQLHSNHSSSWSHAYKSHRCILNMLGHLSRLVFQSTF